MITRLGILGYGTMGKIYKSTIDDFAETEISLIFTEKEISDKKENLVTAKWSELNDKNFGFFGDMIDGLIITVPEWMRLTILKKAIKLNVPILIDKPLASSWKETKEIKKIFKESEDYLFMCNTLIFNPIYRNLLDRVRNGECGELGFISSSRDSSFERKKRIDGKIFEGYWLAPHDIGFTLDLIKKTPEQVYCGFREEEKQLSFNYELYFENGLITKFESCFALKDNINAGNLSSYMRVVGHQSTIEAYDNSLNLNNTKQWLDEYPDIHEWHNTIALNRGYLGSPAIDFALKIKKGKGYNSLNHSLDKAISIQKIIHKLQASSKSCKRIDF